MKLFHFFLLSSIALLILTIPVVADSGAQLPPDPQTAMITTSRTPDRVPVRDEADEVIWSEDFENGVEGWESTDLNETFWHVSDFLQREDDNLHWGIGD